MTPEQRAELVTHHRHHIASAKAAFAYATDFDEAERMRFVIAAHEAALAILTPEAELHRRIGANVAAVLADFGWDHAVVRAEVESERHADSVVGCMLVAIERAMRGEGMP